MNIILKNKACLKTRLARIELELKNFTSAKVYLNPDTGKACVVMAVIPDTSQYYNTKIWTKGTDNTATPKTDSNGKLVGAEFIFSKSCTDITDITKAAA